MSTQGLPDDELRRQVFLEALASGSAARLSLAPGIAACALRTGDQPGLAVQVAREALQASQLQHALQRRFEQAAAFDGCFIYLDTAGALVIWHTLPPQRSAFDSVLSRMLSLARLNALDTRLHR